MTGKRSRSGRSRATAWLWVVVVAAPGAQAGELRLPAGAEILVRLAADTSWGPGQGEAPVVGTVEQDVLSGGAVVIPRGSQLRGRVSLSSVLAGPPPAPARFTVQFGEVVIRGQARRVSTGPVNVAGRVAMKAYYCGTPTLHGGEPFKLGETPEYSVPAGTQARVRLKQALTLD